MAKLPCTPEVRIYTLKDGTEMDYNQVREYLMQNPQLWKEKARKYESGEVRQTKVSKTIANSPHEVSARLAEANPSFYNRITLSGLADVAEAELKKMNAFGDGLDEAVRVLSQEIPDGYPDMTLVQAMRALLLSDIAMRLEQEISQNGQSEKAGRLNNGYSAIIDAQAKRGSRSGQEIAALALNLLGPNGRIMARDKSAALNNDVQKKKSAGAAGVNVGDALTKSREELNKAAAQAIIETIEGGVLNEVIAQALPNAKGGKSKTERKSGAKKASDALNKLAGLIPKVEGAEVLFQDDETLDEKAEIIEKAKADGTYMKAPNGKKTNLNASQWATVRTTSFKKWFGDWENDPKNASKVVDENGEPMVVYHGTHGDFDSFSPNESLGGTIFFSPSRKEASAFAYAKGASIAPVFLNARNPLPSLVRSYNEASKAEKAKAKGHDSIKVTDDPNGVVNWAVFSPTQIKSATANVGAFSAEEPSILFQDDSVDLSQDKEAKKAIGEFADGLVEGGYVTEKRFKNKFKKDLESTGIKVRPESVNEAWDRVKGKAMSADLSKKGGEERVTKVIASDVKELIKGHYSKADETASNLIDKLVNALGLDDADAKKIADKLKQSVSSKIQATAQKEAGKLLAVRNGNKADPKDIIDKIREALLLDGQITEETMDTIFAEKFQLNGKMDAKTRAQMIALSNAINKTPAGSYAHAILTQQFIKLVAQNTKTPATKLERIFDKYASLMYASMLMGPQTSLTNIISGGVSIYGRPLTGLVRSLAAIPRMIKNKTLSIGNNPLTQWMTRFAAKAKGIGIGRYMYSEAMTRGESGSKWEEGVRGLQGIKMSVLESEKTPFKGIKLFGKTIFPSWLRWGNVAKYSGRNLAGQDKAMYAQTYSGEMINAISDVLAKDPEYRNNPVKLAREAFRQLTKGKVDVAKANETIENEIKELNAVSERPMTKSQEKRFRAIRFRELAYESIDINKADEEAAKDLSAQSIFTGDRGGVMSQIAEFISNVFANQKGAKKIATTAFIKLPFIPFTRIVGNIADYSLDYTPVYGIMRANGISLTNVIKKASQDDTMTTSQMGKFGTKQWEEQMGRGIAGTIIFGVAAGLMGDDEEDDFYLSGNMGDPENRNMVYIKGHKVGTYKNMASLDIPFTILGNYNDARRYRKEPEQTLAKRTGLALLYTISAQKEKTYLRGVSDLADILSTALATSGAEQDQSANFNKLMEKLTKKGGEAVTGTLITNNAMIEQIEKMFDDTKYSSSTINSMVTYLTGIQRPLGIYETMSGNKEGEPYPSLDLFGREVHVSPGENIIFPWRAILRGATKDKYTTFLAHYGAQPTPIYNSGIAWEENDDLEMGGQWRDMTEKELYEYRKLAGENFKAKIDDYMEDVGADPELKEGGEWSWYSKSTKPEVRKGIEDLWSDAKSEARYEMGIFERSE